MNKVILIGNLTRDPEMATTNAGINYCKFGLAVNRTFTNASGERDADFFNVTAWRGLGENCGKFLSKGSKVAICGRIETSTYEKQEMPGVRHHRTDIVADDVEFLSPRNAGFGDGGGSYVPSEPVNRSAPAPAAKKSTSELTPLEDDGLPF